VDLETELHTPRQSPVNGVALAYCRALTVNDSNRIAVLLAQCANPHIRLDNLAMHLGIADGTLSKMRGALLPAFRLCNQQLPLYY
jgi:hypothetical protein